MQESYGTSPSGNLKEAVRGISNPAFLILMSNAEQFETHVAFLHMEADCANSFCGIFIRNT